jgi:kumamolisin
MTSEKVPLAGSERQPVGTRVGELPTDEIIEVSVILKPKARAQSARATDVTMSRQQFAANHGADEDAIAKVTDFAKEYNLTVTEESPKRRTVKLAGTIADMRRAFGVQLEQYEHQGHQYRARTGTIQVPQELESSLEAVLGPQSLCLARLLCCRPQSRPQGPRCSAQSRY